MLQEDDAVSPVIGVILMVAITVILAAVIASFVLGLGNTQETVPNTNFDFDYDDPSDTLEISVSGGESFTARRVSFEGSNIGGFSGQRWDEKASAGPQSQISAGESVEDSPVTSDYEIQVIWISEDTETSTTLAEDSGPEA